MTVYEVQATQPGDEADSEGVGKPARLVARSLAGQEKCIETNGDNSILGQPPLKLLHAESTLIQAKIQLFAQLSDGELIASLRPGEPGSLKTRPDGTVIDGHHRIKVLQDRGIRVDDLPRDVIPKK